MFVFAALNHIFKTGHPYSKFQIAIYNCKASVSDTQNCATDSTYCAGKRHTANSSAVLRKQEHHLSGKAGIKHYQITVVKPNCCKSLKCPFCPSTRVTAGPQCKVLPVLFLTLQQPTFTQSPLQQNSHESQLCNKKKGMRLNNNFSCVPPTSHLKILLSPKRHSTKQQEQFTW